MDYQALIAPLAFGFAMQISAKYDAGPKLSAFVAVGVPFIITTIIGIIRAIGFHYPIIGNAITLPLVVILILQYAAALLIFEKLQYEDGLGTFLLLGVGGLILIVTLIPAFTTGILH